MKVLYMNCVYPYGSTGKLTAQLHNAVKENNWSSVVIYSRHKAEESANTYRVCSAFESKVNHFVSRISGLAYGGCLFQTARIIRIIKKEKPDIVHLQCINGYFVNIYRLVEFLKKSNIPTVLTLHAEFMFTANCGCTYGCENWRWGCGNCPNLYKAVESYFFDRTSKSFSLMQKSFDDFKQIKIVGVSEWLSKRAKASPIMKDLPVITIKNGIDTEIFKPSKSGLGKSEFGLNIDKKTVLWVTSLYTYEKGNDYFVKLSEKLSPNDYQFVVAGSERPDGYNGGIKFLGQIHDQKKLAILYSEADVTVCCSRQESYPTVFLESLCCGTPVVGFDVGGVSETVYPNMGEVVPLGNMDKLSDSVRFWASEKKFIDDEIIEKCRETFSMNRMNQEYLSLYKGIAGNNI